jgi:ABC-type multidrug transport system fused ATPase/permease subunit
MQHGGYRRSTVSYWDSSWYSYLTYGWVNPLVETGVERQITLEDTPEFGDKEDALVNTRLVLANLDDAERSRRSHPLLRGIVHTFWPELLVLQLLRVAAHFLGLLDPILMGAVLVFQERQNDGGELTAAEARNGFQAVTALIVLGFAMIFFNSQMTFFQNRLGVRMGSALRGAVLQRCIRGEHGEVGNRGSGPSVYNVISFDIDPCVDVIWIIMAVWLFPIQFTSTLYVLFQQVGWAIFPGVVAIIIAKIVCGILLYHDGILRHTLLVAKDRRLKLCDEGFYNIRALHMLSWTKSFEDKIMAARKEELRAQRLRLWCTHMASALDYSLSMIVTLVTLTYYTIHMGGELKASVAIPVIQLIANLIAPIGQFPTWMNQYLVWKSAYKRVTDFIGLGTSSEPDVGFQDDAPSFPPDGPDMMNIRNRHVAAMKDCSLSWGLPRRASADDVEQPLVEPCRFELQNLDLGVNKGQLLVVTGSEGQGKSSLLMGLLGEMSVKNGIAHSPAITRHTTESRGGGSLPGLPSSIKSKRKLDFEEKGSCDEMVNPLAVPFSAQTAMLFTGSVRMNILFGCPLHSSLYSRVLRACALEDDVAAMPAGDLTEVAQAGATLSGGQKRRVSIARTVYRAALAQHQEPGVTPLVLLDDPLCSLDKQVAQEVADALFGVPHGLLASCAVVVATADPWWVSRLQQEDASVEAAPGMQFNLALVRAGRIVAVGAPEDLQGQGFVELDSLAPPRPTAGNGNDGLGTDRSVAVASVQANPQGDEEEMDEEEMAPAPVVLDNPSSSSSAPASKMSDGQTQTDLTEAQEEALHVVKEEERDEGQVGMHIYESYLNAVGTSTIVTCAIALTGIMVFQNLCNLWIAYWTTDDKTTSPMYTGMQHVGITPPTEPYHMLWVFAALVLLFTASNFAGHALEVIGGVAAAGKIFLQALNGAFTRPFRWWDANPTGRVLNRFSEDVQVMDAAITQILGVIFGAVLYFIGHAFILALSNPLTLLLLPFIASGLEYYARYYRETIRELHRIFRTRMGLLYQDMVEAILGRVTLRSFARENQTMAECLDNLDRFLQVSFCKQALGLWLGLRMALIGYILSFWVKLRPILQFYGYVGPQATALVGFSISYSTETVGIIQQFITNYSDLEMQLISIERLTAYENEERQRRIADQDKVAHWRNTKGLLLADVTVTYRAGLLPALAGVSLSFSPGEVAAIVGRTGAGKSSLLLSILQLVPYEGNILVDGQPLEMLEPEDVRRQLVGVVPQQPVLFDGNLRWNLDPENAHSDAELWTALGAVGLETTCRGAGGLTAILSGDADQDPQGDDCEGEVPERLERLELSQGQQQMLCSARVLLRRTKVVMLDEVSAALPAEAANSMVSTLVGRFKEQRSTVLMVTHQESLLTSCERVVRIASGRVVSDEQL